MRRPPVSALGRSLRLGLVWGLAGGFAAVSTPSVHAAEAAPAKPAATLAAAEVDPLDWPNWRGPRIDGTSPEVGIPDSWKPDGENQLWKSKEMGSRSSPVLLRGKIYTINNDKYRTQEEGERVVCADAATGKILWSTRWNVFLSEVPDTRVGWSNLAADPLTGRIYAQGVGGLFVCLEGDTGKIVWQKSLTEEYGVLTTYGGRTNIPTLFEDLVIISGVMINWGDYARPTHRFLAMNKATGEPVWFAGTNPLPDDTTYSMPVVCTLGGQAAIVFGAADGWVYALQPRTGKEIWKYQLSVRGINCTPTVVGNTVYIGASEENVGDNTMGIVAAIDGVGSGDITKTNTIWAKKEVASGRGSIVKVGDKLYVPEDTGKIFVMDAKTGEVLHKEKLGTIMRASLTYADGKIFAGEANGRWYTFKILPDGKLKATAKLRLEGEFHASPVVSHGKLYVTSTEHMYCIGAADAKPEVKPLEPQAVEEPADKESLATHLQVVPVEAILQPGQKIDYKLRLYDARGRFVKEVEKGEFTLTRIVDKGQEPQFGEISADGVLTAPAVTKPTGWNVTAKVGNVTGSARVRIYPPLPWKYDFADKDIPVAWVGIRYRHIVRPEGGDPVMVKLTTIPKGTRSQGWFGSSELADYTIQADVLGKEVGGKLPDAGLIGMRYRFDLQGASQSLRLHSWTAHELKFVEKPFSWKADVWYTMKLDVRLANEEGKQVANVRGKIWPRAEKEPAAWTIEAKNPLPDVSGSPGLYGNAKDAEVFYDNILVTPNAGGTK